jgi:hypothetical protein
VETHIFLCFLAYHLLVAIEATLLNQGVHTSWATVREIVANHNLATMVLTARRCAATSTVRPRPPTVEMSTVQFKVTESHRRERPCAWRTIATNSRRYPDGSPPNVPSAISSTSG